MENEIKKLFFEQTGKTAKAASRISFTEWMVETEDGETYYIH